MSGLGGGWPMSYTAIEALARGHDTVHPDHDADCKCFDGLISRFKHGEIPKPRPSRVEPRPYVSPFASTPSPEKRHYPKRWMYPRAGESEIDRIGRLHFTCLHCGYYQKDHDLEKLNRHEDAHGGS